MALHNRSEYFINFPYLRDLDDDDVISVLIRWPVVANKSSTSGHVVRVILNKERGEGIPSYSINLVI